MPVINREEFTNLEKLLEAHVASGNLTNEQYSALRVKINEIVTISYKAGVKAGYLKILQDHRDGSISISSATITQLSEAIRKAQNGELQPSLFFAV